MTLEELKANYTVAYRIIMRERAKADSDHAGELENLSLYIGGVLHLVGNGGLDAFEPDADLDAALVEAYTKVIGE